MARVFVKKEITFNCEICKNETKKMSYGYVPKTCGLECQRKLMSAKYTGRKLPQETIDKLKGRVGWNRGVKAKPEAIEKLNAGYKKWCEINRPRKSFVCLMCNKEFQDSYSRNRIYCSVKCRIKSEKGFFKKEFIPWNKGKIALIESPLKGIKRPNFCGANHPRWIEDRTKLSTKQERNDSAYFSWRREVWTRDNFKCRIKNKDCSGRIEAHHILSWREYPELRYQINNGITLCHFHHPRVRKEEAKLIPVFQELVKLSK